MEKFIVHPDSKSELEQITDSVIVFKDQSTLPVINGIPVLFSKDSIFTVDDIVNSKATTQNKKHTDKKNIKNYIRRQLLPSLNKDFKIEERYKWVANLLPENSNMLVIGVGEKSDYYKKMFPNYNLVTSDVHNQFNPDFIFDGHHIPFANETFDIVFAAQVIEHTINPWQFCLEMQRVTKTGGYLQVEAPQNFPYHAAPYDFFRFTFTGFRSLFGNCEVVKTLIPEGSAALLAVTISNFLVNLSSKKQIRSSILLITRFMFGWLKYFDAKPNKLNKRLVSMPIGYAFTFKKDNKARTKSEMLNEFYALKP